MIVHTFLRLALQKALLDQGELKLLVESLVEGVEISQNKRAAASLQPPVVFGFVSPDLAPRSVQAVP
jgi:hypothetical protein